MMDDEWKNNSFLECIFQRNNMTINNKLCYEKLRVDYFGGGDAQHRFHLNSIINVLL